MLWASFLVCSVKNKGSPSTGAFISKHASSRPTRRKQNFLCLHRDTELEIESSIFPNCRDLMRPRNHQLCPLNHSPQEKASWVIPSQLLRTQQGEPPGQEPRPFHQDVGSLGSLISKEDRFLSQPFPKSYNTTLGGFGHTQATLQHRVHQEPFLSMGGQGCLLSSWQDSPRTLARCSAHEPLCGVEQELRAGGCITTTLAVMSTHSTCTPQGQKVTVSVLCAIHLTILS